MPLHADARARRHAAPWSRSSAAAPGSTRSRAEWTRPPPRGPADLPIRVARLDLRLARRVRAPARAARARRARRRGRAARDRALPRGALARSRAARRAGERPLVPGRVGARARRLGGRRASGPTCATGSAGTCSSCATSCATARPRPCSSRSRARTGTSPAAGSRSGPRTSASGDAAEERTGQFRRTCAPGEAAPGDGRGRGRAGAPAAEVDAALDGLLRPRGVGLEGGGGTAVALDPALVRFYRAVARDAAARGALAIRALTLDGRPVAVHLGLVHRGSTTCRRPRTTSGSASVSPGQLLQREVLAECEARGLSGFDFLGPDMPWKRDWEPEHAPHDWLYVYRPSLAGPPLHTLKHRVRPAVKEVLSWLAMSRAIAIRTWRGARDPEPVHPRAADPLAEYALPLAPRARPLRPPRDDLLLPRAERGLPRRAAARARRARGARPRVPPRREVGALAAAGAIPRFVRVDGRMRLDLEDVERRDRAAHRALYVIHYAGFASRWTR